jgi:hypothetical protein
MRITSPPTTARPTTIPTHTFQVQPLRLCMPLEASGPEWEETGTMATTAITAKAWRETEDSSTRRYARTRLARRRALVCSLLAFSLLPHPPVGAVVKLANLIPFRASTVCRPCDDAWWQRQW